MHFLVFLLFICSSVIFIFLVMIQTGKSMEVNSSNFFKNNLKAYNYIFSKNNGLFRLTTFFAIIFFICNLLLCNILISKKNKSIVLDHNNHVYSTVDNKSYENKFSDIPQ